MLTKKEQQTFLPLYHGNTQIVSSIFVRHAIRHGTYDLYSLGTGPSPDFPRPQQDEMQQLQEQVKGLHIENQNLRGSAKKAVGEEEEEEEEEEEGSIVGVDGGSIVGEEDGSTGANGHPNGPPSAPTPEQAAATEESRKLLERQRKVLAAIHRSGAPVQAATTSYSAVPPQVRPKHRHARGGRVRTGTHAHKAVQQESQPQQLPQPQQYHQDQQHPQPQQYPQAPWSGYDQPAAYTPPSWPEPHYDQGAWNRYYSAQTAPSYMQQPQGLWNGFPTDYAYDASYPNSFHANTGNSYEHHYVPATAYAYQANGTSSASQVQVPIPQPGHGAAAAALRADAHEFRPSSAI
jgi:hypothetical protein